MKVKLFLIETNFRPALDKVERDERLPRQREGRSYSPVHRSFLERVENHHHNLLRREVLIARLRSRQTKASPRGDASFFPGSENLTAAVNDRSFALNCRVSTTWLFQ